jgi:protein tyrosine/serine phosphatase
MTVLELIEMADEIATNALPVAAKLFEYNRLARRIADTLDISPNEVRTATEGTMGTAELLLDERYLDVYLYWMTAMLCFRQGEIELYEPQRQMFEEAWGRFERDVCMDIDRGTACGSAADPGPMLAQTAGGASGGEPVSGSQVNELAAAYLREVEYDPDDTETTRIISYAIRPTDYRKDQPAGLELTIRAAGTLSLNDAGGSLRRRVTAGSLRVYNLTPGAAAVWAVCDGQGRVRQSGTLLPEPGLRMIRADSVNNLRDLGGWACDGGRLRYGLIFRGGELDGLNGIILAAEDRETLRELLGIRAETDLRDSGEISQTGSALGAGVDYERISAPQYLEAVDLADAASVAVTASVLRRVLRFALDGTPHYLHCVSGCDRTGTIAFLLGALCGMSRSDLDKDYELSSFSHEGVGASRSRVLPNWQALVGYLDTMDGPTLRDRAVSWFILAGFSLAEINGLRAALIDGTPEQAASCVDYSVKGIQLNSGSVSALVGDTLRLTAAKLPVWAAGEISWSSSDSSVAAVSGSGGAATVSVLAVGSAVITASCGGKSASCTIAAREATITYETVSTGTVHGVKISSADYVSVSEDANYAATDFVAVGAGYSRYRLSNEYSGMPHDGTAISNVYLIWYTEEKAYLEKSVNAGPEQYGAMIPQTGSIPAGAAYFRVRAYSGENAEQKGGWFDGMVVELGAEAEEEEE